MKIIFVSMQYHYGNPAKGKEYIGEDGFRMSFEKCGHAVYPLYFDEYLNDSFPLQAKLLQYADEIRPDLIFFTPYTDQFHFETLQALKAKYKTIAWFGDDTWRFDYYTSQYANYFTYVVTTDKYSVYKYRKLGQKNVIYSQWAAIDQHQIPEFKGYRYDISFVGGYSDHRDWFIRNLRARGLEIAVFGHGWPEGSLSNDQMNEIFIASRISLNIPNGMSYDVRHILDSLRDLPFLKKVKTGLKMALKPEAFVKSRQSIKSRAPVKARNFEIPYFGGFQLTDYMLSIEDYFHLGEEVVCFTSVDEAEFLIRYYLENQDEREHIKERGIARARKEHTYYKRFQKILEAVS